MVEADTRRFVVRPFVLLALVALLGSPAAARMVIKATPASVGTGWPFATSYSLSLLDVAAGAEVGDLFAVAGGVKAYEWSGWRFGRSYSVPLPVYGYVLMNSEEQDYTNRVLPYLLLEADPFALPRYNALVAGAGLGVAWNFYVVSVGAEFKAKMWRTPYDTDVLYTLELTAGLGGWYALGGRDNSSFIYNP